MLFVSTACISTPGLSSADSPIKYGFWPGNIDPSSYQPNWGKLTHVAYASWDVNRDGSLNAPYNINRFYAVRDLAHQHRVKVIIMVVSDTPKDMDYILAYHQKEFINNVLNKLQTTGADGVNIDWEEPNAINSYTQTSNTVLFEQLMKTLYIKLKTVNPNYHISFDTSSVIMKVHENKNLSKYIDSVFLMDYNMGRRQGIIGPNSPMFSPSKYDVRNSVNTLINIGYDERKIILGVPFFGYDHTTVAGTKPGVGPLNYTMIDMKTAISNSGIYGRHWDLESQTPWYSYKSLSTYHQIWYDDEESLRIKYNYSKDKNLGGIGFLALGFEGNNAAVWNVFN